MNDAATIVISVDNTQINSKPDKWRIGQLIFLSCLLGFCLLVASLGHYFIFKNVLGYSDDFLETVMYLQLSSCPHFMIFATRLPGPFWSKAPSLSFFAAIMGTQVVAMLFAVYGVLSSAIGWLASLAIMSVSLVYLVFLDQVKLFVCRHWSYELTVRMWPTAARRAELKRIQGLQSIAAKFRRQTRVAKTLINASRFILNVRDARLQHVVLHTVNRTPTAVT
jgi:H+-transporting ATPase